MQGIAYMDGTTEPLADAKVHLMDRGFLVGDGVFETLRVSDGAVFRMEDHMERMAHGLQTIGMDASLVEDVEVAIETLVDVGREEVGPDQYIRVNVTGGVMMDIAGEDRGVHVTGICKPFQPYPMKHYSDGVRLVVAPQRKHSRDPLSTIKHLSYLPSIAARRHALQEGAHDALMLNEHGRVAEASTSNVFALVDDTIHSPGAQEGALPGVTRQAVLELLEDTGLDVERQLDIYALRVASEVFVTNTTGGVVPVTRFEGKPVAKGHKGDLTTRLGHSLEDLVRGRGE